MCCVLDVLALDVHLFTLHKSEIALPIDVHFIKFPVTRPEELLAVRMSMSALVVQIECDDVGVTPNDAVRTKTLLFSCQSCRC